LTSKKGKVVNNSLSEPTEQQQEQNRTSCSDNTIADISDVSDVDSSSVDAVSDADMFRCPECGKVFSSATSLRGHRLKVHGVKFFEKREKEKDEEGNVGRRKEHEPLIPTEKDALRSFLENIRFPKVDAVLSYCDELGYDVSSVYYALKKSGASRDVLDSVVSYWSLRRNEPIPPHIKRELKPPMYERPYLDFEFNPYEGEGYTRKSRYGELGELVESLTHLLNAINRQNNSNSETSYLKAKIEKLEKQLEEQKYKTLEAKIDSLKEEVENQKKVGSSQWDLLRDIVQHTHETVLRVADAILPKKASSPPSERKVVSESEIPRYLEEMGGEQYLE